MQRDWRFAASDGSAILLIVGIVIAFCASFAGWF
jgi:hypothetical protein